MNPTQDEVLARAVRPNGHVAEVGYDPLARGLFNFGRLARKAEWVDDGTRRLQVIQRKWLAGSGLSEVEIVRWTRSQDEGGGSVVGVRLSGAFGPTRQSEASRVLRMAIAAAAVWESAPPASFIIDLRDAQYWGGDMLLSSWEAIVPTARVAYICNPENFILVKGLLDEQAAADRVSAFHSESSALDFAFRAETEL